MPVMSDFEKARRQMVDCQLRPNDITDLDILGAFGAVPREMFVPASRKEIAYSDSDIMIERGDIDGADRFLMQVTPFAKILKAAAIKRNDLVLCIGCGSGYGSAVIARLAGSVVGIDESQVLVERASDVIDEMGIDNLAIIEGNLKEGCPGEAPFDVIVIEGAVDAVPDTLFTQLRDKGRLVAVLGEGLSATVSVYLKQGDTVSLSRHGNVSVPYLSTFKLKREFTF